MSQTANTTAAVVGLGSMGMGMARTLVAKGFRVLGFDLSAERKAVAAGEGIETPDNIDTLFREARFLVFSLPTAKDVKAVVDASGHLLGADGAGRAIIIDTSTSEPDVSRALAAALDAAGHGFLDAPVSGGPAGAASGKLTMMIGGSDADLALARPVIDALAAKAIHVGPSGAGNVAKLVNNLLAAAHMVTTGEALKLALAAGISAESALGVLNAASGRSMISEVHFPTWVMNDGFDSGFSMALMRKDVRLANEMANSTGADTPLTQYVAKLWAESGHLADSDDFTRMGAFKNTSQN